MSTAPLNGLGESPSIASRRTIPFDVAFKYDLVGERGKVHRNVVTVSIEGSFVAVSIGYGVVPQVAARTFGLLPPPPPPPPVPPPPGGPPGIILASRPLSIRAIQLGDLIDGMAAVLDDELPGGEIGPKVAAVLADGLKINSDLVAHALADGGNTALDDNMRGSLFQAVAAPADRIQFRYALFDDGTGREFQTEPILNIAGLGAADGDRPFRRFARPITFRPRSTIRLEITEEAEFRGQLHVALQGYKVLGGSGSPTSHRARDRARRRLNARGGLRPLPR
jgi:hypothetical protein